MLALLCSLFAFTISIWALAKRAHLVMKSPRINHHILRDPFGSFYSDFSDLSDELKDIDKGQVPRLPETKRPFLEEENQEFLVMHPKGKAYIYFFVNKTIPFKPKSFGYDIGMGRIFFTDEYGQHFSFQYAIPTLRRFILWYKIRLVYLVYPKIEPFIFSDKLNWQVTPCFITMMPYYLVLYTIYQQED